MDEPVATAKEAGEGTPIEFWFDFTSPYAYFASIEVEGVAGRHGRTVTWRPFLLGAAFKTTGMQALTRTPMRGEYGRHDWARLARRLGVPLSFPTVHPASTVAAGRAFLWLEGDRPELAVPFARAVFAAHFGRGEDIGTAEQVLAIAEGEGADRLRLGEALASPELKEGFRARTERALARGVFGSPFFFVDGEPFWGADRLPMIDEWLRRGGW
jgi:2-hydroxychromene-2-carboxylate isomerase